MPARAPASIDMLQTVMRSSMSSARMASPRYSMTWPVPPPTPILPMMARIRSFAVTPGRSLPLDVRSRASSACVCSRHCVASTCADLRRADAEGEGAERAVRARVAVAADDGLAGLRRAELRTDDVHDAALLVLQPEQLDAELARSSSRAAGSASPRTRW